MAIVNIFEAGGAIMYPLAFLSVLSWAVAIEKALFLRRFSQQSQHIGQKAALLIGQSKTREAKGLCHNVHPLVGRPFLAVLDAKEGPLERRLRETQQGLRRYLWILGTIGSSSPFIGLFGTVVGIIKSFESISEAGKAGFAVVADGLAEALVATAAGILVAVIALFFYNYFQNRLNLLNLEFKHRMEDLRDGLP